ncbi:hypothetical protein BT93_J1590 [Corymbia citriodora subsp. variegata]|nr:hypothetical protein BT93_J1590 [Corymbia citriodora subsp. variegata]
MYLSEKPHPSPCDLSDREMMLAVVSSDPLSQDHHHHHHQQMILADSSGGEDPEPEPGPELRATKKRAETWVAEETRSLIGFRREVDGMFNTSKSNKHLWEQISSKMREKGFDRSPTMCTDKWRNLLKEFKKARQHQQQEQQSDKGGAGSAKMTYYKELEELLRERNRNGGGGGGGAGCCGGGGGVYGGSAATPPPKVDPFIQFSDKVDVSGFDDSGIQFGPMEASGQTTVNMDRQLDQDANPLAITTADAVEANGVPPWNWRDAPGNGGDASSYGGRVITVKLGDYIRKVGIDGSGDAIKEAIKSAFRLRTKRAFWLEDENQVIRSLDRDMPIGNYTLHLDEGITIKVCMYDGSDGIEEKTLYTEEDFRDFLTRGGWIGLREVNGYRSISSIEDLHSGVMYEGVRILGD